ncbi:MAG: glutamate synthase-related protein [Ginsengibacter sp.]
MFENKKNILSHKVLLLIVVLVNILIIKVSYINNQDLYWLFILSIPMLVLAIYYAREKHFALPYKKKIEDRKLNIDNGKSQQRDHSIPPNKIKADELTVLFGNSYCTKPYLSSIIYIGSESPDRSISYLPRQIILPADNNYPQDIQERLTNSEVVTSDLIWRIGPDYVDCSDQNSKFNPDYFRLNACRLQVKMIELKLSGFSITENIFTNKSINSNGSGKTKYPGSGYKPIRTHSAFSNADSMALFLDRLKQLSGRKPVGVSLCITNKRVFHEMCYVFRKTEIIPDYIVIEDCANNNNSLFNFSEDSEMPLYEALLFASSTLKMYGLNKETKLIAATKIYTAFDVLKISALGADAICMQNHFTHTTNKWYLDYAELTNLFQQCMEGLRSEILSNTINLMQSWGYLNRRDITVPALIHTLDALHAKDFVRIYNQDFRNGSERKSFRIVKENNHEENRNSAVSLN